LYFIAKETSSLAAASVSFRYCRATLMSIACANGHSRRLGNTLRHRGEIRSQACFPRDASFASDRKTLTVPRENVWIFNVAVIVIHERFVARLSVFARERL
jgi:hypothetical protein